MKIYTFFHKLTRFKYNRSMLTYNYLSHIIFFFGPKVLSATNQNSNIKDLGTRFKNNNMTK